MPENKIVAIVSPPYEEAVDGGGIFKEGYRGKHIHEMGKNQPDKVGSRTYSKSFHNFSDGQIGSLKSQSKEELDFDITKYHKCLSDLYWFGCYEGDDHYKQYFEPSTYAHPAKISPLLADRIFKHLEKLELLKEGMTVLDFMAGSGRVPLLASLRGYKSIGLELEPHFTKMCNDNKKFAENKIGRKLDMEIIQGDSRQLSKLLKSSDIAVLSPPYGLGEGIGHSGQPTQVMKDLNLQARYGSSEGNIGNLPYKDVVAVVSPPFETMLKKTQTEGDKEFFKGRKVIERGWNYSGDNNNNPSNIGNLKYKEMVGIVSPPYQDAISSEKDGIDWSKGKFQPERDRSSELSWALNYSQNPQNIGNLKDKEFVGITSPAYENMMHSEKRNVPKEYLKKWRISADGNSQPVMKNKYSDSTENLGNQQGENYLSAMLQVYKEASKVCPVICTITKNPTRAGKLRRLDLDTTKLLELSGYKIIDYHRAVLFKTFEQQTLTGKTKKEYKGRLSFFKRLSLAKGNTASEFEDILIGVKI